MESISFILFAKSYLKASSLLAWGNKLKTHPFFALVIYTRHKHPLLGHIGCGRGGDFITVGRHYWNHKQEGKVS